MNVTKIIPTRFRPCALYKPPSWIGEGEKVEGEKREKMREMGKGREKGREREGYVGKGKGEYFRPIHFFLRKPLYLPLHYLTICQHYCLVFLNHMFAVFKNLIYIFSFECMANSAGSLFSFWMRCSVAQLVYTDTS